jgi:hypothetical protein
MKKINSEVKVNDEKSFKVTIGTTNKKFTDSIYVEVGSYIVPLFNNDYKKQMVDVYKRTKRFVADKLSKSKLYGKNFILVDNIATDRMTQGKRSYYEIQLFLKNLKPQPFKLAANDCKDEIVYDLVSFIKDAFKEEDFECYKTKG